MASEGGSQEHTIETYFDLIKVVGSKGMYQQRLFCIFFFQWLISAFLLMGTSFMFMNRTFECGSEKEVLSQSSCESFVCSLDEKQWPEHYSALRFETLATEYGPFDCDRALYLNQLRSTLYVGVFMGYMVFLSFSDNIGRRTSLLLTWAVTAASLVVVAVGQSIEVVCVGLFLAGAGCESAIRISMTVLSEVVDYYKRQNYSIVLNCSFGVAGIGIGVFYQLLGSWRPVTILFVLLPSFVVLALIYLHVYETPKYLLRQGNYQALKCLNEIAQINRRRADLVTYQMISQISGPSARSQPGNQPGSQPGSAASQFTMTPLKLLTLQSLRKTTILTCVLFFCVTYLYSGPIVIIDKIGLSALSSQIIVSSSELFAYPIAYVLIRFIPRRRSGIFFMVLSAMSTAVMVMVTKPLNCETELCKESLLEVIMVFCSRFCVSFYFSIFFLYVTELFPLPARGVGFGMSSAAGAIATASGQILLPYLHQHNINPMLFFTVLAVIAAIAVYLLPETLNRKLQEEIKEHRTKRKQASEGENQQQFTTEYQLAFQKGAKQWTFLGSVADETEIMFRVGSNQYRKLAKFVRKYLFFFYDKNERFQEVRSSEASDAN